MYPQLNQGNAGKTSKKKARQLRFFVHRTRNVAELARWETHSNFFISFFPLLFSLPSFFRPFKNRERENEREVKTAKVGMNGRRPRDHEEKTRPRKRGLYQGLTRRAQTWTFLSGSKKGPSSMQESEGRALKIRLTYSPLTSILPCTPLSIPILCIAAMNLL